MDLRSNQALEVQQIAHRRRQLAPTTIEITLLSHDIFDMNYKRSVTKDTTENQSYWSDCFHLKNSANEA